MEIILTLVSLAVLSYVIISTMRSAEKDYNRNALNHNCCNGHHDFVTTLKPKQDISFADVFSGNFYDAVEKICQKCGMTKEEYQMKLAA